MKVLVGSQLHKNILTELLTVVGGALLLFAASQIEIPLYPVPITLQTVAVMLIGLTYSPRRALEAHLLWLAAVAVGLPVLSEFRGGLHCLVSPTAGYLVGFVLAAYCMASLKKRFSLDSWKADAGLTALGTCLVFASGVLWLSYLIGAEKAFLYGVLPFIFPGVVKAGLLCTALQIARSVRHK